MQREHVFNTVFNTLITEAALNVLSDARDNMVNSLTMNLMNTNGKVSLEESEFFGRIVDKVIMEATGDFIPEEVDIPDESGQEPVELWDAAGNKYVFQDGQLYNAEDDGDGDVDPVGQPDVDPAAPADVEPAAGDLDPADAASEVDPDAVPADDGDGDVDPSAVSGEGEEEDEEDEEDEEEMEENTKISKGLENIEESTLNSHDAVRNIMNKLIR